MRLLAFVISLLLLGGAVEAETPWLVALAVVAGIAAFRMYPWRFFTPRPALDVRMASFVLAVLLAAGAVEATKDWLIAMSIVSGVAAFMPGIISLDHDDAHREWGARREWGRGGGWHGKWGRRDWRWDGEPAGHGGRGR